MFKCGKGVILEKGFIVLCGVTGLDKGFYLSEDISYHKLIFDSSYIKLV